LAIIIVKYTLILGSDEIKENNVEAARKHAESKDTATGATKNS